MDFDDKSDILLKEIKKKNNLVELVFGSIFGDKKVLVPEKLAKDVLNKGETYQGGFNDKGYEVPETMEYIVDRQYDLVAIFDADGEILWN